MLKFTIIKYLIPYVIFGSFNYYFAKEAVINTSPIVFNLIRYLISSLIFLILGGKFILNKDIFQLALYTSLSSLLWAFGLEYVSPGASAVLSYTMPLFSIPIAMFVLSEKPSKLELIGLTIGFLGVIFYGLPLAYGFTFLGAIITVINAIFWALFSVYYRKLRNLDPISVNFSQFVIGSAFFTIMLPFNYDVNFNEEFIEGIAYTSTLGGALSFFLWNLMVKVEKIARVTILAFSVPILTTVEEIFFNVFLYPIQIIGMSMMFIGIVLSRLKK